METNIPYNIFGVSVDSDAAPVGPTLPSSSPDGQPSTDPVVLNFGIRVYSNGETDDSKTVDTKIINKASIVKDGKYYTLLEIPIDMSKNDTLCGFGETLLVFKNQKTSTTNSPISLWGLDKNQSRPLTPESSFSLSGLGSYGDGSPVVNKNILTCQLQHNNLKIYIRYLII